MSSVKLANLETFARAVATLRGAEVDVDIAALADLYDVDWPDDGDEDDEHEPTDAELAAAHKRRTAAGRA
jgi:hypothetical protein